MPWQSVHLCVVIVTWPFVVRMQATELTALIKELEGHKGLVEETARLKQLRARLATAETMREELAHVRRTLDVGSFLQFYHFIAPIKWDLSAAPGQCKGSMRAPHTRPSREQYVGMDGWVTSLLRYHKCGVALQIRVQRRCGAVLANIHRQPSLGHDGHLLA